MNKKVKNILRILLSLALALFIFWFAYRKMDTKQIFEILRENVRYEYIWIAVLIGIFSDLFRALRWKILIDALDEQKPTVVNTFFAVMIGYFVNFLVPRAGEVVRCGIITRYHKIAITKVIGTMLAERAFDIIVSLLILLFAFLFQMKVFSDFVSENVSVSLSSYQFFLWPAGILLVSAVLFFIFRRKIENTSFYKKIAAMFKDILIGIKTSLKLKNRWAFFFYTIAIWLCYYLMIYVPTFAFDFTAHLSVFAVAFVFAMGNLGNLVPVQGGIGAWHFMTIMSLALFGVGEVEAGAFALIVHGSQMLSYMIGGVVAMVGLQIVNRQRKLKTDN